MFEIGEVYVKQGGNVQWVSVVTKGGRDTAEAVQVAIAKHNGQLLSLEMGIRLDTEYVGGWTRLEEAAPPYSD